MNHYEVLGISKDASKDQIKQAYRKLALQNHPDKHVHSPKNIKDTANLKFKKASAAYETLINDGMRANYDSLHRSSNQSHYDSSSSRSSRQTYGSYYKSDYSGGRGNYDYGRSQGNKSNGFHFEFRHGMGKGGFKQGYGIGFGMVVNLVAAWMWLDFQSKMRRNQGIPRIKKDKQ